MLEKWKQVELLAVVDRFELPVQDRRLRDVLVEALAGSRSTSKQAYGAPDAGVHFS